MELYLKIFEVLFPVFFIVGISSLGIGLILFALNSNLDYFLTPSELKKGDQSIVLSANRRVKLGGMVKKDSFSIIENKAKFEVTDFEDSVEVIYEGLLPDLFKEGKGIVVLDDYRFNKKWQKNILKYHNKLIVFDDNESDEQYADILINYNPKYSKKNFEATINKNIPKNLLIFFLSSLCTVFAPILAMKVVIGIKIKNAGTFKNPILKGKLVCR